MNSDRLLVCGSRDFQDYKQINAVLDTLLTKSKISVLIHGDAKGADLSADKWAKLKKIQTLSFPYHIGGNTKAAGPIRNRIMATESKPTMILAFPSDPSKISAGTRSMINIGLKLKIPVYVVQKNNELLLQKSKIEK